MIYRIRLSEGADRDIKELIRSEPQTYKKLLTLLLELQDHPATGTGHPKPLGANLSGRWSRRINQKHRLVYEIRDKEVLVLVLSAKGHYEDK
jgi:toxin YoeB